MYTGSMADWDAAKYHRISDPQLAWGRTVAARLVPAPPGRIVSGSVRFDGRELLDLDPAAMRAIRRSQRGGTDDRANPTRRSAFPQYR